MLFVTINRPSSRISSALTNVDPAERRGHVQFGSTYTIYFADWIIRHVSKKIPQMMDRESK